MRVLTIVSTLGMGGIEKTLLSCIPFFNNKNIEVTILCAIGGGMDKEFEKYGVKIIDFGANKKPFKDAKFLRKLLSEDKYDIVHSRLGHTSGLYAKVCYKMNIPLLVSIHNERAMFRNNWIGKPLLGNLREWYLMFHKKLTLKYASKIIGHSKANLKYYKSDVDNLPKNGQLQVLYNGVDFSKFKDFPDLGETSKIELKQFLINATKVFVHIGSFKEQKNHSFLINVFKDLWVKDKNYKLILIGGGELLPNVKKEIECLGLKENVLFTGVQSNIGPYLYASDIFIFPSLYEGFGNVLIEAQYVGLPVAVSSIPPHYEAIYSGYYKYMFNPADKHDAVKHIEELINCENLTELKSRGMEFATKFSIESMVANLEKQYESVLSK